jgi:hypothetical protein
MHKQCSFPMKPDAKAASDTCQHTALSGVVDADGITYWRCGEHVGLVDRDTLGEVVYEVPVPPEGDR